MINRYLPTFTGKQFNFEDIWSNVVCVEDVAHHFSNLCRYAGATREFYSVAQHAVLCATYAEKEFKFEALHHDDSEAYMIDLPHHLKRLPQLEGYVQIEHAVEALCRSTFEIKRDLSYEVKVVDRRMAITEKRDLFTCDFQWYLEGELEPFEGKIIPWTPYIAERNFLAMHELLKGVRS